MFLPFPQCPFCNHANPAGAKFCNDCGSPLHLKPCNQCEAVNDQIAKNCYKCGTELPVLSTAPEAAPVSPALDTTAASAILSDMGFERGHAPLPESVADYAMTPRLTPPGRRCALCGKPGGTDARVALRFLGVDGAFAHPHCIAKRRAGGALSCESHDVPLRPPRNETTGARDYAVEAVTGAPRSLGSGMTSLFSAAQRAAEVMPLHNLGAAAGRRPLPRLALVVVLSAALLTAVGVSAYYAYRHQMQLGGSLSAAPPSPAAPADVTALPGAPADVTALPVNQSLTRATGADGDDGRMPTPSQSDAAITPQLQVSTSDQAAPAQQLATQAAEVARAPDAATAIAAEPRHKAMPAAASRVAPAHSAVNPSTSTYRAATAAAPVQLPLSDRRVNVPPDAPRPGACTDAVAALGLCSLTSRRENK